MKCISCGKSQKTYVGDCDKNIVVCGRCIQSLIQLDRKELSLINPENTTAGQRKAV